MRRDCIDIYILVQNGPLFPYYIFISLNYIVWHLY